METALTETALTETAPMETATVRTALTGKATENPFEKGCIPQKTAKNREKSIKK